MAQKKHFSLAVQILIGLVLGIVVGVFLQGNVSVATTYIAPFGTLFLNLIKMIIVPLVFSSLLVGISGLEDIRRIGKIGGKAFLIFFFTTSLALIIGLILGNLLNVGGDYVLQSADDFVFEAQQAPPLSETLLSIIPSNPLQAIIEGDMLQIITFAIILGVGVLSIGVRGEVIFQFFDAVADAMYAITSFIMKLAPFGVFALIVPVIASNGTEVLLPLLRLIIVVYFACLVHIVLVYGLFIKFLGKMNPIEFFKRAFPAFATAFTTSSSAGTIPVSMQVADRLGIPKSIYSFTLPLGATINMDGTAIYQSVCALFIAQVYGIDLSLGQQVTIVITATLASIGTAGVPGAGMIMLAMVLQSVNLPVEGIALVAGIERILDMARTSVNVLGDLTCSVVVSVKDRLPLSGIK